MKRVVITINRQVNFNEKDINRFKGFQRVIN